MTQIDEIKYLIRFLEIDPTRKVSLAAIAGVSTTSAVDKWIIRNRLPRTKRRKILNFMQREQNGISRTGTKG